MSLEIIEMQYGMEHVYIAAPHEEEIDSLENGCGTTGRLDTMVKNSWQDSQGTKLLCKPLRSFRPMRAFFLVARDQDFWMVFINW
eukprot:CAMPEP_0178752272 /NCGR_PEP_ID=MMETSP0744-20121128/10971_1 /TAXON_ID=913974 /ORGANISM="Nitzschia punctata, Strain CCMP561" /LENGTH=84 /DNA_ID=CAMNT_0020405973 /DNA_START=11 /DNA_END=262 /DNA_ORIENTATION=+